jgi:crotonobetainyl-CoA:carnitine CoA-transferase CaiB-like acyl-CoA transferase
MLPLAGVKVLDFSTLLPGPLAGLLLAEAGADVIKVERPGVGDEMRTYEPKLGADSANFVLLNRGKRSVAIDLKASDAITRLTPLIQSADVLIEQFRPGVMQRLGLGFDALSRVNPRLIYCSITGFGQTGPRRDMAAHDLNYLALAGLLSLTGDKTGAPGMPHAPIADIAGGTYPAVINILLALLQRQRTGHGTYLDISMTDNLFLLAYWGLANGFTAGVWPKAGAALTTGGSPRYGIYRTADGGYLSAGPIEQRFWELFCRLIELDEPLRDDSRDPDATRRGVASRIAAHITAHWQRVFDGADACCAVVMSLEEAVQDPQVIARNLFARRAGGDDERAIPALPVPIVETLRDPAITRFAPRLGADNGLFEEET